jgi:dihydrolipoamide dehydrogenase
MKTDILVIGAGPAGYVAALKAAQGGARVTLIERRELGGTCLNRGCIPSKTYLYNAEIIASIAQAAERGIRITDPAITIDLPRVVAAKNQVVRTLTGGIRGLLKSRAVEVISGTAVLQSPREARVDGTRLVTASQGVIVACGSQPSVPPIPGAEHPRVLTSDHLLDLTEMPEALVIIGAGVVGLELAQIYRSYGIPVTLVEAEPRIAPFLDADLSQALGRSLGSRGIVCHTGATVSRITTDASDHLIVTGDHFPDLTASHVLIATGRKPDLAAFGTLPVRQPRGFVEVADTMQTSIPGVYAPGDINGRSMLAHAASRMGEIAVENALGRRRAFDVRFVPGCIYGMPEVAWVGLTEEQARARGEVEVGRFPFAANGRALCCGHPAGFIKLLAGKQHKELLGVHIVGPTASELINEAAALMAQEITADELAETVHAHPTHAETLMEAAAAALGRCLHLP